MSPNYWLDPDNGVNYNVVHAGAAASIRLGRARIRQHADFIERRPRSTRTRHSAAAVPRQRRDDVSHSCRSRRRCPLHRAARNGRRMRRSVGRDLGEVIQRGAAGDRLDWASSRRHQDRDSRSKPGDARSRSSRWARPGARDHPGVSADGREFSVMARTVHHHDGGAGRARGSALDAGADAAPRSTSNR